MLRDNQRTVAPVSFEGLSAMLTPVDASKKNDARSSHRREIRAGIVSGIVSGALVGVALFVAQGVLDDQRTEREHAREERQIDAQNVIEENRNEQGILLENLRFVRALSSDTAPTVSRPFRGLDLHGLELSGLSLAGADFENANLGGTIFRNTELSGARFGGANVDGADFTGSDLKGASFYYETRETAESGAGPDSLAQANLDGVAFRNISTWGEVNLSGSSFCGATFDSVDFSEAFLAGSALDSIPPAGVVLPSDPGATLCR
jgi:uncharacterized protein YjbI with pentapeptide repeats